MEAELDRLPKGANNKKNQNLKFDDQEFHHLIHIFLAKYKLTLVRSYLSEIVYKSHLL